MTEGGTGSKPDFTHLGYLHFGTRARGQYAIRALKAALEAEDARTDLSRALLVLPEAFNVIGDYGPQDHDRTVAWSLAQLSKRFRVAFVAGLMDGEPPPNRKSVAKLIDGDAVEEQLQAKVCRDDVGSYGSGSVGDFRPFGEYRGLTIAALICIDARQGACRQWTELHERAKSMAEHSKNKAVLCIPAHNRTFDSVGVVNFWACFAAVVLANSATEQPSVIRVADGGLHRPDVLAENSIKLVPIPT